MDDTVLPATANARDRLDELEQRLVRLNGQLALERIKNAALMKFIIETFGLGVADAKSSHASLSPIEKSEGRTGAAVLAFSGLALQPGMPVAEFYRVSAQYDHSVYFVKDHHQAWFQRGLPGLSHDIFSTADILRELVCSQSSDLRTLGTSAGGFAALVFGVLLKARTVVSISPQTCLTGKTINQFKSLDTRVAEVLAGQCLDVVPLLERNESTEIHVHYGLRNLTDTMAAERLRGLPHVTLHPHDSNVHTLANWMKEQGILEEVLAPVFD